MRKVVEWWFVRGKPLQYFEPALNQDSNMVAVLLEVMSCRCRCMECLLAANQVLSALHNRLFSDGAELPLLERQLHENIACKFLSCYW